MSQYYYMPGQTPDAGGYTCQVCGSTYETQQLLIQHGREQHPGKPVTWGDPIESTLRSETDTSKMEEGKGELRSGMESMGDKMKAGAKAVGSKIKDPDRDLETEYQKKKGE